MNTERRKFTSVAAAGITFQAGSAAVDSATIISALVFQLTGSPILVGAVTAILRFGWLFPQLFVGFLAQRDGSSIAYYKIGAFGRAACMALLAAVLVLGADWGRLNLAVAVMGLWMAYAFVSGIVAVPYNDIVARSIPSDLRSRLLATRFFGGGLLALAIAAIADRVVTGLPFPQTYAVIIAMAAGLMFLSSGVFVSLGEPASPSAAGTAKPTFFQYLRDGIAVFQTDRNFRLFVFAQWGGGAVLMAMPFYVVQAHGGGFDLTRVAVLLGAQTAGALASNALWGWWGDRLGKASLLAAVTFGRIWPPAVMLLLGLSGFVDESRAFVVFISVFFVLGALANGLTIAVIGYLMEISPDSQRAAYSGYFNAITAPAFLLPFLAGIFATYFGLLPIFAVSMLAAAGQFLLIRAITSDDASDDTAVS